MVGRHVALLAAIGLAASPAIARPSPRPSAQALSIERVGAEPGDSALTRADWLPALLFTAIVIGGVLLAIGVIGDNDKPASP